MDSISDPYRVGVNAQCCGHTSGCYISNQDLMRLRKTGEKWYGIVPPGMAPGFRTYIDDAARQR